MATEQKPLAEARGTAKSAIQLGKEITNAVAKVAAKRAVRVKVVAIAVGYDGLKLRQPGERFTVALIDPKTATIDDVPLEAKELLSRLLVAKKIEASDKNVLSAWLDRVAKIAPWQLPVDEYERVELEKQAQVEDEQDLLAVD